MCPAKEAKGALRGTKNEDRYPNQKHKRKGGGSFPSLHCKS